MDTTFVAIVIVATIAKMAILAMAIGVVNMTILSHQLKSVPNLAQWRWTDISLTLRSDNIIIFVIL